MRNFLTASILLALLSAPAAAATLKLKDGTTITGKATRYDSPSRMLYFRTDDGRDVQYTMDQLDARSVYQINASLVPKDDAQKQLQVANFARDAGLYAHAARRYRETLKTAPSLEATVEKEMTLLRRSAAEWCMKNARTAIDKKDVREAEKWLKVLVEKLPEEPEAAEAASMLERYYAKNREEKMAAADAKASDALRKDLEKGKLRYQQMVDKCQKGLQARGSGQAEGLFRGALADGKAVLAEIDKLAKKYPGELTEKAGGYRKIVTEQMVETHLHLASQMSVKSDYNGALKEVNAALALDPQNEAALSARVRIEENANEGLGWRRWQ